MQGRCFNCLARDHQVAQCRDPTRCWECGRSGHISARCRRDCRHTPWQERRRAIEQPIEQNFPEECWQVVQPRRSARDDSECHSSLRRAIYLSKVRGKCFNCLASDHRVAQCQDQMKCWVCRCTGHISYGCPSRRPGARHSSKSNVPAPAKHNQEICSLPLSKDLLLKVEFFEPHTLVLGIGRNHPNSMDPVPMCLETHFTPDRTSDAEVAPSPIVCSSHSTQELDDMLFGPVPHSISDDTRLLEDPMRIEAQLMTLTTEETTASNCGGSHISHTIAENQVPPTSAWEHSTLGLAATNEEALQLSNQGAGDTSHQEACNTSGQNLENFLKTVTTPLQPPILSTPVRKKKPVVVHDGEENTVRRSERIAEKKKARGNKNMEQLAEEAIAKKLGVLSPSKNLTQEARERYLKMFDGPLTQEAMDAIEDLLKAMNLNKVKAPKKGKKRVVPGEA